MDNLETTFIYTLEHPITNEIRYIGKTSNPKKRLRDHINVNKNNTYKEQWVNGLKSKNLLPILNILDVVPLCDWEFWEIFYIDLFKSWNFRLTNIATGGGSNMTNETKLKLSNIMKGRKYRLGKTFTDKQKENISNGLKGRKLTSEHINKKAKGCFKKIDLDLLKVEYEKCKNYDILAEKFNLSESKIYRTLRDNNLIKKEGSHMRKKIICVETNKTYNSISEARKEYGNINISNALNHNKTAGGFHWEFL